MTQPTARIEENENYISVFNLESKEEEFSKFRSEVENLAKEKNKKGVFFSGGSFYKTESDGYYHFAYEREYPFFEKILGDSPNIYGYVKTFTDENLIEKEVNKYKEAIKELKEVEPTIDMHWFFWRSEKTYRHNYYSFGKEGIIDYHITENGYCLSDYAEKVSVENHDIKETLYEFFDKIKNKRRLETLFDEPEYHLRKAMGNHQKSFNPIKKALLHFHKNDEIENHFALEKNRVHLHDTLSGILLFKAFDVYIITEQKTDEFVATKDKEEAIRWYEEKLYDYINKKLEKVKNTL